VSQLPLRPSLSHLRKQAKELHERLQQQNPDATLVEAQHALAREYGFASWPKLKVHVERLATLPTPVTFQRYTPKAREAVFFSRLEASRRGSPVIEPEHVLLGLIRASRDLKGRIFDRAAVSLEQALAETTAQPGREPLSWAVRMSTGTQVRQIFRAAVAEADALQHREVGLAHLLLGMLRQQDLAAAALLSRTGLDLQSVRNDIATLLNEESV
jgi:hypothetical protein